MSSPLIAQPRRIVVKLGTGVLTSGIGRLDTARIAAIATETDGTGFDALLVRIGGNAPALRQLLDRLKSKGVIDTGRDDADARVYKLSPDGKKTLKKITK